MNEAIRILAINPGSTSTKIAVYTGTNPVFIQTLRHTTEELAPFKVITDQFEFRKNLILKELKNADIRLDLIRVVMGRGGLLRPVKSGVFEVNDIMLDDLRSCRYGEHASNLGGLIAYDIARSLPHAKAYITNPVVVDELDDVARISGHPLLPRRSIFHALNQKAVARQHAKSIMRKYEELNLIVVHLGGGITVGAHKKGQVVDVNQGLDGDGPFSPERSGTLPVGDLARLCFSGKYTLKQVEKMIKGEGGLVAYLGTNSAYEVGQRTAAGDEKAKLIYDAMAYQVAKEVGAMGAVLKYEIDGILITGGIAHDKYFVNQIISYVHRLAPVHVYPGEDEMKALAMNGLRVIKGEVKPKTYPED
ncbi:butyrate kinase [Candidatus Sulfidibacterium hydrothermale]|uniref:butyrate kinase n=1 Tax=Candidatus Sulfidibacterium hydrothermale TaxID=2875962 RepID=UPI001F0AB6F4|nr:butyrate kinase [Candidatus Sulfidibacterium hydrothermale]UBM62941.1 butyrate kinase [Candidatus Sulfidibacterium hydrothermale]